MVLYLSPVTVLYCKNTRRVRLQIIILPSSFISVNIRRLTFLSVRVLWRHDSRVLGAPAPPPFATNGYPEPERDGE